MSPPRRTRLITYLITCGLMITSSASSPPDSLNNGTATLFSSVPTVYVSPEVESKTVKVVQSYGVHNNAPSNSGLQLGFNTIYPSSINFQPQPPSNTPPQYNASRLGWASHYGSQPNSFLPSHFLGYKTQVQRSRPPQPRVGITPPNQKTQLHQKVVPYTPNAQRRVDSDVAEDDSEAYNEEEYERDEYRREMEQEDNLNSELGYEDHYHYGTPPPHPQSGKEEEPPPETRESPFAGFPVSGPGFVGPAPFDPLPPPPQSIKGSVDYILIPLVLIGLAGPIFVVLYVILGAFEAKLSPITRSLDGYDAYKPYLDNLISSVGRSLDTNECLDYAACQFGSFSKHLGYADTYPKIQKTLDPFMPHPYKRRMRQLFNSMKNSESCSIQNCIRIPSLSNN